MDRAGGGANVNSVTLNKYNLNLAVGESETLVATVNPATAVNKNVSWSSSDETVATVTVDDGKVTALKVGNTYITVTTEDGGKTASCLLQVSDKKVTKVEIISLPDKTVYGLGEDLDLTGLEVEATYTDDSKRIIENTALEITGFDSSELGDKAVTVTYFEKSATFDVNIIFIHVDNISFNVSDHFLIAGETKQLAYTITPGNASNKNVNWVSTKQAVATVLNGVVTAKASGDTTIIVTTVDGGKTATCNVNVKTWEDLFPLDNLDLVARYLAAQTGGNDPSDPVDLPVSIYLLGMGSDAGAIGMPHPGLPDYFNWRDLLIIINTAKKYVNLDLSSCTLASTGFYPNSSYSSGKDKIVSIILPDAATSIPHYQISNIFKTTSDNRFDYFTELREVTSRNVTIIGKSTFYNCPKLKLANFPLMQTIYDSAFKNCVSLENIKLPRNINFNFSIDIPPPSSSGDFTSSGNPFAGCPLVTFTMTGTGDLETIESNRALVRGGTELVLYPSASGNITLNGITTIGQAAFADCANLETVNLPDVSSMNSCAFFRCSSLYKLDMKKIANISNYAFALTEGTNLTILMGETAPTVYYCPFFRVNVPKTVTVKVPAGATGYGPVPSTYEGNNDEINWGNELRNNITPGTPGSMFYITVNQNITVHVMEE